MIDEHRQDLAAEYALDALDPEPCAGVYAEVLRPGRIRTGDAVRLD
jgi:MOSC domain-containing protein YiiM